MNQLLLISFLVLFCSGLTGQNVGDPSQDAHSKFHRCSSDESFERLIEKFPDYKDSRRILESKIQDIILNREVNNGIIVVPVVYHVIHNGDAVGSNENLSVALLQAQLDQMNDDFRRMNSDAGNTPAMFSSIAADSEIEFCLAQVDPTGNATTGINRHNISTLAGVNEADCWTDDYIDTNIKIPTIWNSTNYLNIWTTFKINRNSDCAPTILGYAQFPNMAANTDGIVLKSSTVGSIAMPNPAGGAFAIGRTGTHEAGHYFNLFHIWGNVPVGVNGCTLDDAVTDTPLQASSNSNGAPCTFPGPNSCNSGAGDQPDMFQNYMDYSDDVCMNLFTEGQKTRMIAAINASRPGLLTAACAAPSCEDDLVISGNLMGDYYADNSISTSGVTTVQSTEAVELRAPTLIYLGYGFSTDYGGSLYAGYGTCAVARSNTDYIENQDDSDYLRARDSGQLNLTGVRQGPAPTQDEMHAMRYPAPKPPIDPNRQMTAQEIFEMNEMIKRDRGN